MRRYSILISTEHISIYDFSEKQKKKIDTRLSYQSIANFLQIAQHEHPIARPLQALL